MDSRKTWCKPEYFLLFLIVILGLTLRFHDLGTESLWTDEIISLNHAQQENLTELVKSVSIIELTPPGYFVVLSGWINLFGISEFSLRFLSALVDSLSIILIFLLGRKIFNTKSGVIASILYATMMLQIVYAQEARNYSLFIFFALLSTYLFLQLFLNFYYNKDNKENLLSSKVKNYSLILSYVVVGIIALYLNYMMAFLLAAHVLAFILITKNNRSKKNNQELKIKFYSSIAALFILYLPGLYVLSIQLKTLQPGIQAALVLWGIPASISKLGAVFFLLPLIMVFIGSIILYFAIKKLRLEKNNKRYLQWFTIAFLIIIYLAQFLLFARLSRSFSLLRHSIFIIPFIYLLLAYTISLVKSKRILALLMIVILLFNFSLVYDYYETTTKAPWDQAVQFIETQHPNQPVLLTRSGSNVDLLRYYESDSTNIIKITWKTSKDTHIKQNISFQELQSMLEDEEGFWLISSRDILTEGYYTEFLEQHYVVDITKEYKEMSVYHYVEEYVE